MILNEIFNYIENTKTANQAENHNCNMAYKSKEARSTRRSNNQKVQSVKRGNKMKKSSNLCRDFYMSLANH